MKINVIALVAIVLMFSACKKFDKLTQFNMDVDETFEIPSTIGINLPFDILTPNIRTNSESTFEVNETRKDLIEEINLKSLQLNMKSPSDADFSFLKSIEVYISAEGLSEIKMAWKEDIPADIGNILTLDVSNTDLSAYIKKDEIDLRLNTVTRKLLGSDHTVDMHSVFFVDAKILGQ
jgi:hypothetical protein